MYKIIQVYSTLKNRQSRDCFHRIFFIKIEGYPPVNIQEILGEGFVILKVNPKSLVS